MERALYSQREAMSELPGLTPIAASTEILVALRSSRVLMTVPSRMSRTISSSARSRVDQASQSTFTLRQARLMGSADVIAHEPQVPAPVLDDAAKAKAAEAANEAALAAEVKRAQAAEYALQAAIDAENLGGHRSCSPG